MTRLASPALVLLAGLALAPLAQAGSAVVLSGKDTLAVPGTTVTVAAKLEKDGFGVAEQRDAEAQIWRRDIKGRTVRFFFQGQEIGSAVTDDEGMGYVAWNPPGVGEHEVEVRFEGDSKYDAGTGSLVCGVQDGSKPTVVVDIDQTLSTASKWQVIQGDMDAPPLEGAPAILTELMAEYEVVYVTARIKKFQRYTRAWLAKFGLPRRPIYFMDFKKYPTYDEAQYKIDTIGPIREIFPGTTLGIGDKKSDAEAYRHHGLRALILGDAGGVAGAEEVADWAEIRQLLLGTRATAFRRLHAAD